MRELRRCLSTMYVTQRLPCYVPSTVVTYSQSTIIDTSQAARYRTCSDVIFRVTLSSTSPVPHREHSLSRLQRPFTERYKCAITSVVLTTTRKLQKLFVKIPNMSFHENKASEGRAVPCGRQKDGWANRYDSPPPPDFEPRNV